MEQREFKLVSKYKPAGSQPQAIKQLVDGINAGQKNSVLLGVTGSGKTFTMANVIANTKRPALVIAHNKTLAAQLCNEFRQFFPHNRVEYFVSYYDYYQPEAYIPSTDTFIEKDMSINDEIDKLRHSATSSLLERSDVIVVASVSCIYGLGAPKEYYDMSVSLRAGNAYSRSELIKKLVSIQYKRAENDFIRSTFRSKGDVVDIFPAHSSSIAIRVEFFGDRIEEILEIEPLTGAVISKLTHVAIFPATHYVVGSEKLGSAVKQIKDDLTDRLKELEKDEKLLEAHRLKQRVNYDIEMISEMGYCSGIENYSRYFDGRKPGEAPFTLLDYFPEGFLLFIDESHISLPQIRGMFNGDKARKAALVDYGFRLPSAYDNRPLNFTEFNNRIGQAVYVSATPAPYELELTQGEVVEQIIRPTGLLDPEVVVRPQNTQVKDLLDEIKKVNAEKGKTLVTTLTKKMAEDLTAYYTSLGIRVRYLHSEIDTLDRIDIINALRSDEFDVLVGINLLREGLDLPEVMLVAILDADKEGFLRSETSLIQTIGRAARNVKARVIMYANNITGSMQRAIGETNRRRTIQDEYNKKHGITPQTIVSELMNTLAIRSKDVYNDNYTKLSKAEIIAQIERLKALMDVAAKSLDFESAIKFREEITRLKALKRK